MDGLLMFIVSAVTPWLLEQLTSWRRFPLMHPYAPVLNRLTPIVLAGLVAAGITVSFDEVNGVLTIKGLIAEDIVRGLLLWIVGAGVQHFAYERAINQPKVS